MEARGITTAGASRIDVCPDCGQPFVLPVALLDIVDEGLYLVVLHCMNCQRMAVSAHEDAEMEEIDRAIIRAVSDIEAFADILDTARFIEEAEAFTVALRGDHLLPEDF
jgi:hypothetical protein